jgi:hypothetical protein
MADVAVLEILKHKRAARGEPLAELARRIGVRQENLQAIEDGRLGDLPPGIYGRAAVRSFAAAYGFDPAEVLSACEPFLRAVEEPIGALARLHGRPPKPPARVNPPAVADAFDRPSWRPLAAAAIDACIIMALLLVFVLCAAAMLLVPVRALGPSAPWLAVMGFVLGAGYFVWFGGVLGTTIGARALGLDAGLEQPRSLTLEAIAIRTMRAVSEDVRCIERMGAWVVAVFAAYRSQAV